MSLLHSFYEDLKNQTHITQVRFCEILFNRKWEPNMASYVVSWDYVPKSAMDRFMAMKDSEAFRDQLAEWAETVSKNNANYHRILRGYVKETEDYSSKSNGKQEDHMMYSRREKKKLLGILQNASYSIAEKIELYLMLAIAKTITVTADSLSLISLYNAYGSFVSMPAKEAILREIKRGNAEPSTYLAAAETIYFDGVLTSDKLAKALTYYCMAAGCNEQTFEFVETNKLRHPAAIYTISYILFNYQFRYLKEIDGVDSLNRLTRNRRLSKAIDLAYYGATVCNHSMSTNHLGVMLDHADEKEEADQVFHYIRTLFLKEKNEEFRKIKEALSQNINKSDLAILLFELSLKQSDEKLSFSYNNLAVHFRRKFKEEPCKETLEKIIEYYRKGCEYESPWAMKSLGRFYATMNMEDHDCAAYGYKCNLNVAHTWFKAGFSNPELYFTLDSVWCIYYDLYYCRSKYEPNKENEIRQCIRYAFYKPSFGALLKLGELLFDDVNDKLYYDKSFQEVYLDNVNIYRNNGTLDAELAGRDMFCEAIKKWEEQFKNAKTALA